MATTSMAPRKEGKYTECGPLWPATRQDVGLQMQANDVCLKPVNNPESHLSALRSVCT